MTISTGLASIKVFLDDDQVLVDALGMFEEYVKSLQVYISLFVLPDEQLDMYCRGMIFGLEGSKMLVKAANILLQPGQELKDAIGSGAMKGKSKRAKKGVFDVWNALSKKLTEVGEKFVEGLDPNKGEDL